VRVRTLHCLVRIQSLAGFFRIQDTSYHSTEHSPRKVRVTGYLLWDDEHNGSADVGSTVQYIGERRISSFLALDRLGDSPGHENRGNQMKYWEIIADNLSKAGWSRGCVSIGPNRLSSNWARSA
jgi:hypothetical protein